MTIQHKLMTGADLHEPKAIAAAASGTVYRANGTGGGAWVNLAAANLDFSAITTGQFVKVTTGVPVGIALNNANIMILNCFMSDAANADDAWVVAPKDGTITTIWSAIYNICDADTIITPSIAGVNLTSGAITITAVGSVAGDVDSSIPVANNSILAGQALRLLSNGGATASLPIMFTILLSV